MNRADPHFGARLRWWRARRGMSQGHEGLVPFVETCIGHGDNQGREGPAQPPAVPSGSHASKYRAAECAEFGDVRHLADAEMHEVKHSGCGPWKDPVEDRNNHPGCLLVAEVVS